MATPIPENGASFRLAEVLEATGGRLVRRGATEASGVTTDSRASARGKLFVALVGERFDGHEFTEQVAEAGAHVLLVERLPAAGPDAFSRVPGEGPSVVLVEDTLRALGDLARFHRRRWAGRVIAIGGSAGKTTTKNVVARLLTAAAPGAVLATPGNLNNRIGVPMTMFGLGAEHRLAVLELGTNQRGEMAELGRIVEADVALLTLIDLEHTEGLGDLDGVEREEGALFQALGRDGVAIGFLGDERVARQLAAAPGPRVGYATADETAFAWLISRRTTDRGTSELEVRVAGRSLSIESGLVGGPGALAVLAGLSVAETLFPGHLTSQAVSLALRGVGEPGRSTLFRFASGIVVLDDTYNSNPASVESSIETGRELSQQSQGRLWLVLGAMLELGKLSAAAHRHMGELAARSGAQGLLGVSGDARLAVEAAAGLGMAAEFFSDAAEVAAVLAPRLVSGDVVVVKASRGVRAERVVADLRARIGEERLSPARSQDPDRPDDRGMNR